MKKRLILLFMVICLVISACASGIIVADPIVPTDTKQPEFSVTNTVQSTPTIPAEAAIPTEDPSIELVFERNPVDSNMVKGVAPAVPLKLDESGNIVGLSPDVSQTWADNLKACYNAVTKKYPTSEIYLDVDVSSNSYVIIILMGGTVFYQTFKNQDGNYVYSNFPSSFENVDNKLELFGDYKPIKIPNTSLGVIWTDGIPQLLANYVELPNGETYFTHYMDYSVVWDFDAYPWKEVTGVNELMLVFPAVEMDLEPIHVQNTEYEYMGVKIKANLVVDKSCSPELNYVGIDNRLYSEIIAKTLFNVWWVKGYTKHVQDPDEQDFQVFMEMWSTAQKTKKTSDWEKVRINDIWFNDLRDGFGYVQKSDDIWPMYFGDVVNEIQVIDEITYVFVCKDKSDYITKYYEGTFFKGSGTNKDTTHLYIYLYFEDYFGYDVYPNVAASISSTDWWLTVNKGGADKSRRYIVDMDIFNLLRYSGLMSIY